MYPSSQVLTLSQFIDPQRLLDSYEHLDLRGWTEFHQALSNRTYLLCFLHEMIKTFWTTIIELLFQLFNSVFPMIVPFSRIHNDFSLPVTGPQTEYSCRTASSLFLAGPLGMIIIQLRIYWIQFNLLYSHRGSVQLCSSTEHF